MVTQFFKYHMKGATYFTNMGWIFAVVSDRRLTTCYYKGKIADFGYSLMPQEVFS